MAVIAQLMQQQHLQAVATQDSMRCRRPTRSWRRQMPFAQQRRAGAGPAPTFAGRTDDDELAVLSWLEALESWFTLAHVDTDADAERIDTAVAALRGSAQRWWANTRAADAATVAAGGTTALDKWASVVALLREAHLPQDPVRWALQRLEELKHGSNANVQAYTTRFLQLDLMIVGQQNELSRVFAYEQGLPEHYRVRSAEKQHRTLAAAVASSLALWNAKSVARTQTHAGPVSRPGDAARLHHTRIDDSDDEGSAAGSSQELGPAGAASSSSAVEKLEQKLDAFISSMQQLHVGGKQGSGAGRGRRRERQQEGVARPARAKTPGVSEELAKQRLQAGVCIKCAESGHYARDCKNAVRTN